MSGVFICTYDEINNRYVEISRGDFSNPVLFDFNISGSGNVLEKIATYYIVVRNTIVNMIRISVSGSHSHIQISFSLDKQNWGQDLVINERIEAIETEIVRPFYIKTSVVDSLGVFPLNQISNFNDFKLVLVYY